MKRILKTFRPHHRQQQQHHHQSSGTGDLTGGRQASLDDHDDDDDDEDDGVRYVDVDVTDDDDDDTLYTNVNHNNNANTNTTSTTYDEVESYYSESVNENGNRVTTTTVLRVPPPPTPQQQLRPSVAAAAAPSATTNTNTNTRCDETRNLVKKFIADIWNRGELDLIPEVCSPSLRFNGNTGFDRVGHDGLARMVATIRDALDEYHCEIHSMVVEDNKAFCRLRFTGKHVGPLLGYPPTQKTVAWMGATEFTCQNGKILKVWELGDVKSLEEQLLAPPPEHQIG